jgi:hypothetical protein
VRLLITGGTGVLGHALRPIAQDAGHELAMPGHDELDLFDPFAVAEAVRYVDGVLQSSAPVPFEPLESTAAFSIGCMNRIDGTIFGVLDADIDNVVVYQDRLTGGQITDLMNGQGLPAAMQAWYPLRGDGKDYSGRGSDLAAMPDTPVWTADQHGREQSALRFDGQSCPTAESVPVRTDDSFSVSARVWLDPDHVDGHPRVFSLHGQQTFSLMLKYNRTTDKWELAASGADNAASPQGRHAEASVASKGVWTHLAATFDPAVKKFVLYVDGEQAAERVVETSWSAWRASEFVIGCGGTADGTRFHGWDGTISDVRIWRGALTADKVASVPTRQLAFWELGQDEAGADAWGSHDLTFHGDYAWEVDRYNNCWAAYGLDLAGNGYAETAGTVVTTDESFTVSAWARIDDNDSHHVITSQTTSQAASYYMTYYADTDRWQFALKSMDNGVASWATVESAEPVEIGRWYHVVGVFDLGSGQLRIYVDGQLSTSAPGPAHPWHAPGKSLLGAAGDNNGDRWSHMAGSIDQVEVWSGVLDERAIPKTATRRPPFVFDPDAANCSGEEPPPIDW